MVSCNIGHIFLYIIAIVLWISNMMRACLWTLQFWKINFQGLTLTHCNQGVPEGYCAISYIISNPHSRTIWSSKGFEIHPFIAEKTTIFLFRGTFGHTVLSYWEANSYTLDGQWEKGILPTPRADDIEGFQCLAHSNWTICISLNLFCSGNFPFFFLSYWEARVSWHRSL